MALSIFFRSYLNGLAIEFAKRGFLNLDLKSIVLEWIFHNQKEKICCLSRNSKYRASKSKNFLYGKFEGFLDIFGTFMTTQLGL